MKGKEEGLGMTQECNDECIRFAQWPLPNLSFLRLVYLFPSFEYYDMPNMKRRQVITIGVPFNLTITGTGLHKNDRIRLIDQDKSCGDTAEM